MTGKKHHNYPKFFKAEERLRKLGYKIVNPARLNDAGDDWFDCLRNDLHHIVTKCDTIAMLNDWTESKGARLEIAVALRLGFKVIDAHTLRPLDITLDNLFTHRRKNGKVTQHAG